VQLSLSITQFITPVDACLEQTEPGRSTPLFISAVLVPGVIRGKGFRLSRWQRRGQPRSVY